MSKKVSEIGIITEFLNEVRLDIIQRSISAGQKITGETLNSMFVETTSRSEGSINESGATLYGAEHIMVLEDGRGPTHPTGPYKNTTKLKEIIYNWISNGGIPGITEDKARLNLAYIIARKIHQEGNLLYRKGGKSGVISGAITDERINAFIDTFGIVAYNNFKEEAYEIFKNLETVKV